MLNPLHACLSYHKNIISFICSLANLYLTIILTIQLQFGIWVVLMRSQGNSFGMICFTELFGNLR